MHFYPAMGSAAKRGKTASAPDAPRGAPWHHRPGTTGATGNGDPDMHTRSVFPLIATALTALVIGGGTAGAVLAASPGAHAATGQATTATRSGGIQLDAHTWCIPNRTCP